MVQPRLTFSLTELGKLLPILCLLVDFLKGFNNMLLVKTTDLSSNLCYKHRPKHSSYLQK